MKKLLLALFVFSGTAAYSQGITGGLKAGVNFSNFNGSSSEIKKDGILGFHAGGYLNFGIGDFISIQPEALVSTTGAKLENVGGTSARDYKLTYITVPVMLKVKPVKGFYLEAGPQVGFKIDDNMDDQTINAAAKNLDLSVGAGLGFEFGRLGIGARYLAGLSKVGDFDWGGTKPDYKNGVIQAGLSFRL